MENYSLPIQWSVMLEVERSFNHQNLSPHWSLLLLESTAIKWLKYYTNKAISCFYSQCLITKSLPSTQQWLMSGAWQLFTHTSEAPWALFPLCYTPTTAKLLNLYCTSANYRQNPHVCPTLWSRVDNSMVTLQSGSSRGECHCHLLLPGWLLWEPCMEHISCRYDQL